MDETAELMEKLKIDRYVHDTDTYVQITSAYQCAHIKFKLCQVDLEYNLSGDTWSHCNSQPVARAFSNLNLENK
jgi:hypothetical protein